MNLKDRLSIAANGSLGVLKSLKKPSAALELFKRFASDEEIISGSNQLSLEKLTNEYATHTAQIKNLSIKQEEAAKKLRNFLSYREITHSDSEDFFSTIEKIEEVHRTESREALFKRVAKDSDTQWSNRCFAQLSGDKITAMIFMHSVNVDLDENGNIPPHKLTPNLEDVKNKLNEPIEPPSDSQARVALFYTVSSNKAMPWNKGAGKGVIFFAQGKARKEAIEGNYKIATTTLSPTRLFIKQYADLYPGENLLTDTKSGNYSPEKHVLIKKRFLKYYLRGHDPVGMKVHGPNGSVLGEVKLDPQDAIDPIQANHVYSLDQDVLEEMLTTLNKDKISIPTASHLCEFVREHLPELSQYVYEVDHETILKARIPSSSLEEDYELNAPSINSHG